MSAVPVIIAFKDGKAQERLIGLQDVDKLRQFVNKVVGEKWGQKVLVWCLIKGSTIIAFVVIIKCTMLQMSPGFIHFQFCACTIQVDLPVQTNHIHITLYPWRRQHILKHTGTNLHITTQNTVMWAHKISMLTVHYKTMKGKAVYTIKVYRGEQNYIFPPSKPQHYFEVRSHLHAMAPLPWGVEPWYPRIGKHKTRWRSRLDVEEFEQKT